MKKFYPVQVAIVIAVIVIGGLLIIGIMNTVTSSIGTREVTMPGTVLSQHDSGEGVHIFGFCMSLPNCGYTTTVRLSNGTIMHYVDTCWWGAGTNINFTYWSKAGWSNAVVLCD